MVRPGSFGVRMYALAIFQLPPDDSDDDYRAVQAVIDAAESLPLGRGELVTRSVDGSIREATQRSIV